MSEKVKVVDNQYRCPKCGQLLTENQKICPSCKEELIWEGAEKTTEYTTVRISVKPHNTFWSVYLRVLICFFIVYGIMPLMFHTKSTENTEGADTSTQTLYEQTEEPVKKTTVNETVADGFDYQITQIFFETREDKKIKEKIRMVLDKLGYGYENLQYSKGYYTADFKGMKTYKSSQKDEFDEEVKKLEEKVKEQMTNQDLINIAVTIQSGYRYTVIY